MDLSVAASCYLLSWFQTVLVPFFLAIFLMYVAEYDKVTCMRLAGDLPDVVGVAVDAGTWWTRSWR